MKKLLITGFEPFGGQTVNPSWEAVALLPESVGPWKLHKLRIPVEYGEAARLTLEKARELGADAVLSVGQAGGRGAVTPEDRHKPAGGRDRGQRGTAAQGRSDRPRGA